MVKSEMLTDLTVYRIMAFKSRWRQGFKHLVNSPTDMMGFKNANLQLDCAIPTEQGEAALWFNMFKPGRIIWFPGKLLPGKFINDQHSFVFLVCLVHIWIELILFYFIYLTNVYPFFCDETSPQIGLQN